MSAIAQERDTVEKAVANGRAGFVSHFTPSLMEPKALEEIFIGRDELAAELVDGIQTSVLSEAKQHTLLVGPRGIGKSHLVALTYYRVKALPKVRKRLCIAWLHEEEYGITSWLDLLLRIFRALEEEQPGTTPQKQLETLYTIKPAEAEREAEKLLREYIGERTLLLLIENLDEVFKGLQEKGQRQWRAFMQQYPICTTLATSPSLFGGVSRQSAPFYGFFRVRHLEPLTVDSAVGLLQKLAIYRGDQDLADFIVTPAGRARVRAVHHLAGGNHRIYVIFSQFLDRRSLDELVGPFLNMLDELTPYYQSRMYLLSSQQRKIVEILCTQRGAVAVKTLAQRGFMSQQTASSQLQDLRDKGYVVSHLLGRDSLYELREPLMRLCLEVKKQRGEPISLFIDFLRVWYSRDQLQHQMELLPADSNFERRYLAQAIEGLENASDHPVIAACLRDFERLREVGDFKSALIAADELLSLDDSTANWVRLGVCYLQLEQSEGAIKSYTKVIEREPKLASSYFLRGASFLMAEKYNDALTDLDTAVRLDPHWRSLFLRGLTLYNLGRYTQAVEDFDSALKLKPELKADQVRILVQKSLSLRQLGQASKVFKTLRIAEQKGYKSTLMYAELAMTFLFKKQNFEKGFSYVNLCIDAAVEEDGIAPTPMIAARAYAAVKTHRFELALSDAEHILSADDAEDDVRTLAESLRVPALLALNHWREGLVLLDDSLTTFRDESPLADGDILLSEWLPWAFEREPNVELWKQRCQQLTQCYNRHDLLIALDQNLTEVSSSLAQSVRHAKKNEPDLTNTKEQIANAWLEVWREVGRDFPALGLALRLSEAAIRFAIMDDERILLELPIEERKIVREMLKTDKEEKQQKHSEKPRSRRTTSDKPKSRRRSARVTAKS